MLDVLSEKLEDLPSEALRSKSTVSAIFFICLNETNLEQLVLSGNNKQTCQTAASEKKKIIKYVAFICVQEAKHSELIHLD